MKIKLDQIETYGNAAGLASKRTITADLVGELYLDTDLNAYIIVRRGDQTQKYSGTVIIERHYVKCAQVAHAEVPKHQPVGTPPERDTPSGVRKHRTEATGKTAIAERAEARKAAKLLEKGKSVD